MSEASVASGSQEFATTHWSLVLMAGRDDSALARDALEKLCRVYWYPLYAYIRRQGYGSHDAQDLTQGFFARLLEKNSLQAVDRDRGKFRSFLLGSLKHYLSHERERVQAKKRGGGKVPVPIDGVVAEARFGIELARHDTTDGAFERQWALALLDQVLVRLQEQYTVAGKVEHFECLKGALTGEKGATSYATIASRLQMTEGAVKVAVHRLRQRYRDLLRREIAQTVASAEEVDDEVRHLFAALG